MTGSVYPCDICDKQNWITDIDDNGLCLKCANTNNYWRQMLRKSPNKDKIRRIQQLRRSNAATAVPNKKRWSKRMRNLWKKEIDSE